MQSISKLSIFLISISTTLSAVGLLFGGQSSVAATPLTGQCIRDLSPLRMTYEQRIDVCQNADESTSKCVLDLAPLSMTNEQRVRACSRIAPPSQSQSPPLTIPSGSPQAIADCMRKLMYERRFVCTRSAPLVCFNPPEEGFGGWQTQNVRTDISETAAVQACQNAR